MLPDALRILREEAPDVEFALSCQSSPELALALMRGKVDVAFLRRDTQTTGLAFKFLIKEPLIAVLPTGHRLAARKAIRPQEFARETYISPASPALKSVIDDYAAKVGITLKPKHDADNLSGAMSLVASIGGVTLFPLYTQNMLTRAVVAPPLRGEPPTIDLLMGYNKSNTSHCSSNSVSCRRAGCRRVAKTTLSPGTLKLDNLAVVRFGSWACQSR
jgi:LysR family hca operon transcriptional activator